MLRQMELERQLSPAKPPQPQKKGKIMSDEKYPLLEMEKGEEYLFFTSDVQD